MAHESLPPCAKCPALNICPDPAKIRGSKDCQNLVEDTRELGTDTIARLYPQPTSQISQDPITPYHKPKGFSDRRITKP